MENESLQSVRTNAEVEAEATAPDDAATVAAPIQASAPSRPPASAIPVVATADQNGAAEARPDGTPASTPAAPASGTDPVSTNGTGAGAASDDVLVPAIAATASFDHNEQTHLDLPQHAQPASWPGPDGSRPAQPVSPLSPLSPLSPMPPYPGAAPVSPRMPGQMPGNVPWEAASSWGATTLTISASTAAGASYLFWWVSGMLIYFNERHNRFVRFHAMQSILLTGAMTVFGVLAYILSALCGDLYQATGLHAYSTLGTFIAATAIILIVFVWLWAMIAAWSGNHMRLPIVGTYAERYSAPPLHPPTVF